MVHIHDCIAVYPLELRFRQPLLNCSQALRSEDSLFRCNNPDQFPLGLKGENLVQFQEQVFVAISTDNLFAPR